MGLNEPLGPAYEDAEGFEGTAVTSAPSPCEQGSNEGWGVEALKSVGVRAAWEPLNSGCDGEAHDADDLIVSCAHFHSPAAL